MMEDYIDRSWGIYGREMHTSFWFERDHFIDQGTDGRILSKCILNIQDGRLWTGCIWLGLWTSCRLLLMP